MSNYGKTCLTIAGSDSSGGAGIQADLKAFSATGTYGMSVITAITAQNTVAVYDVFNLPADIIRRQIEVVFEDIVPDAIKIGMVSSPEIIDTIADTLGKLGHKRIVVDPVMISKSGYYLLQKDAVDSVKRRMIPLAYLLTPNIPEAEEISGMKIHNLEDMRKAGQAILSMGTQYVLMKGGHFEDTADDLLMGQDGTEVVFRQERISSSNTHGTGCTISSAIASYLAQGHPVEEAVRLAKEYITQAIRHSFSLGHGCGPVHHFFAFDEHIQ
ncbi:MAG: bifunctional hydroxymethylpyrimidine kinase/phosphomethylpyrimidine kinase [Eubacteriales bacterium]|jgi:hydroxymethylpyrimidine/phosphomethylpyrimidine kinase